jgi:16S rRNA (adenine1518-N6/adenine1519-N6)-dimethyltransferase
VVPHLTPGALRELARRHGIRPRKGLGQHFLVEPSLARRIVELAGVGPGDRVLEVGAGLGSLTVALAEAGAEVLALEVDEALLPALREVVGGLPGVRVVRADATAVEWGALLEGPGTWTLVANLPYNVAVPVLLRLLEEEPRVERMLVMVQREVGERLVAGPGEEQYGAVSLQVAHRCEGRIVRRVPRTAFWPEPNVDSVLVWLERRPPPVEVDEEALWRVVREAFAQRRKTMRNALVRLGFDPAGAEEALRACGVDPRARPEELDLRAFACLAERWLVARARRPVPA